MARERSASAGGRPVGYRKVQPPTETQAAPVLRGHFRRPARLLQACRKNISRSSGTLSCGRSARSSRRRARRSSLSNTWGDAIHFVVPRPAPGGRDLPRDTGAARDDRRQAAGLERAADDADRRPLRPRLRGIGIPSPPNIPTTDVPCPAPRASSRSRRAVPFTSRKPSPRSCSWKATATSPALCGRSGARQGLRHVPDVRPESRDAG